MKIITPSKNTTELVWLIQNATENFNTLQVNFLIHVTLSRINIYIGRPRHAILSK